MSVPHRKQFQRPDRYLARVVFTSIDGNMIDQHVVGVRAYDPDEACVLVAKIADRLYAYAEEKPTFSIEFLELL